MPEHADSTTDQDGSNSGIPEHPTVFPELPDTGTEDADSDGAAEPVETPSADFLLDDDISPLEKWEHVDLFEPEQHFELATTPAVHALIEVEHPTMGAEVVAAHVSDKIHYTRAAALADHPGYADSDRTELAAMEKHKVLGHGHHIAHKRRKTKFVPSTHATIPQVLW